jgi:uncharacterized cupin superfamily protein
MSDTLPELPESKNRAVYRDSGEWANSPGRWEWTIIEEEFENMLFLNGKVKEEQAWVMHQTFNALVAR